MNLCATNWPPEIGIDWHHVDNWLAVMQGDWIENLRRLPDASVQCCVTSPPYWGLRDYGVPGQLGLERTPTCGRTGFMRLRKDLTEAEREYVVRRLLGEVCPCVPNNDNDGKA